MTFPLLFANPSIYFIMTSEGFSSLRTGGKGLPLLLGGPGGLLLLLPDPARVNQNHWIPNHIQENLNNIFFGNNIPLIVRMLELMIGLQKCL